MKDYMYGLAIGRSEVLSTNFGVGQIRSSILTSLMYMYKIKNEFQHRH